MKYNGRLEITTRIGCKCNCIYCPQGLLYNRYYSREKGKLAEPIMTLDTFKICLNKLSNKIRIDFSGMAEPWLNSDCTQMLLYAHQRGFPIAVYTTLVGMTQEDFSMIKDIPYQEFVVHIPDNQGNTYIEITKDYLALLEQVLNYEQKGGHNLTTGISCHAGIHPLIQDIIPQKLNLITEIHDRAGNIDNEEIKSKTNKGEIICINCGDAINHNVLLPDGSVLLCCMDYGMKHILGNLIEQTYEEIQESEESIRIKEALKNDGKDILCRNCINARNIYEMYDEYILYKDWVKGLQNKYELSINHSKHSVQLEEENKRLLEKYEHKMEELQDYKSWLKHMKEQNEELQQNNKQVLKEYEQRLKELKDYEEWVRNLQRENEEEKKENKILSEQYSQRIKELKDYENWVQNLNKENQDSKEENRKLLEEYEKRIKELKDYENWVKNLNKENQDSKEKNEKLSEEYEKRVKEVKEYGEWVRNLEKENQDSKKENQKLIYEYEKRVKELQDYEKWVQALQEQNELDKQENQKLSEEYGKRTKELENYKNWIENLETKNQETQKQYEELLKQYNKQVEDSKGCLEQLQKKLIDIEGELSLKKEELQKIQMEKNMCQDTLNKLKTSPFYNIADRTRKIKN